MPLFGLLWEGFMGFTDLNLSIRMGQLEPAQIQLFFGIFNWDYFKLFLDCLTTGEKSK
jgi:hypothetical protein